MLSRQEQHTVKRPAAVHKTTQFEPSLIIQLFNMRGPLPMIDTNNSRIDECRGEFITELHHNKNVNHLTDCQGDSRTDSCQTKDYNASHRLSHRTPSQQLSHHTISQRLLYHIILHHAVSQQLWHHTGSQQPPHRTGLRRLPHSTIYC